VTPDRSYPDRKDLSIRPSWSANPGYLNEGHRRVFEETKDIPGWQMEADTYKLYEMAHFAGDVILELGTYGGRSAVVELKGALGNLRRARRPQLFGLDVERSAIALTHQSLKAFGLDQYALLYRGDIEAFMSEFQIQPTMVFVDADHRYEGVKRDLEGLSRMLSPGVPVLCHDYSNPENQTGEYGIRRAATEWEASGQAEFRGTFGCAALFVTTALCRGRAQGMPDEAFARRRDGLLRDYGLLPASAAHKLGRSLRSAARLAGRMLPGAAGRVRSRAK
jgi:predicted O-methyltransferase YrrM